ncbi:serine hydrolase [Isoptericola variabilis]|uniref:Beta-lactamase n=1 Tax=Isoptericola variabilis (strain 225) TaxID=743718 RepID=F6FR55_ISOV2|nr:serine hydrolase domain-containing protein [Isoptericola variabilis]AEG45005.1 beta-lactamase [Isoptericola variabilis 225]
MTDAAAFDRALEARRRERRAPALAAAVAHDGELLWTGAAGVAAPGEPATDRTAFRVGSITKPMTAVAVLRLVADGRLALDEPVGRWLPDAPAPDATVAHLLTHTAGLPAEPPGPWWERHGGGTWEELVAARPQPLWAPGERFHYSNLGYAVLGRLVEEAHGRAWDAVLRHTVWEPLGMTATGREPSGPHATGYAVHPHADLVLAEPVAEYRALGPAGEVWSTPSDLVRFASWLTGRGPGAADDAVLPLAWRRCTTRPRVVVDEPGAPFAAWGLGVSVHHVPRGDRPPRRLVGHGGSVPGFTAEVRVDVVTGHAVAVCGSSTAGFGDGGFLLDVLDDAASAGAPGRVPASGTGASTGAATRSEDARLTGTWYWGPVPYTVTLDAGRLRLEAAGGGGRATVFARDEHGWLGVEGGYWLGERLRVVEHGGAAALDVGTFHLTRLPYDPRTAVPGGVGPEGWTAPPTA